MDADLHQRCVNTIKGLAIDMIQKANSGHPGLPMGCASMTTVLWTRFLKFDPADPNWADRDRFVLSAGHGSALLYSLLHLSGYAVSVDDLRNFRQWESPTPGHPEYGYTAGVETTTGPLGQGFANAVGMAFAERFHRESFGADLASHYTYCLAGDGCLMEGVSAEAASLAGHLGLGRLIVLYDDNEITIDGGTDIAFTEDRAARFRAYGWHVQSCDGHDPEAVASAIERARAEDDKPSLICARTIIGEGSAKQGTSKTHGSPLGADDIRQVKSAMGWNPDVDFAVPDDVTAAFHAHNGAAEHAAWTSRVEEHADGARFRHWLAGDGAALSQGVQWPSFETGAKLATRKASAACLKAIYAQAPWVIGGSADLAGSNGTNIGAKHFTRADFNEAGTIDFGVREHAMASMCNGIALHGGGLPYCATFLIFHDYLRPAMRLAGLMHQRVIYVLTHDSVFLGEDGPTHQPTETLLAMRSIPNVRVLRPADATETAVAWAMALERHDGPTVLSLTRQGLPVLDRKAMGSAEGARSGGYILSDCQGSPDAILIGTGSEVATLLDAQAELAKRGVPTRVVSAPCPELLWQQDPSYRDAVLPPGIPRISLEAGSTLGWHRYIGDTGLAIGIDSFGWSAPAGVIAQKIGFTGPAVADRVVAHLA